MQILTERPTEEGQYVMLWEGAGKLWTSQIRVEAIEHDEARTEYRYLIRLHSRRPANDADNWEEITINMNIFPKTFLKL